MKLPVSWLKDYIDIDIDIDDFADIMTMSGSKVEAIEYKCKEIKNVVTGKILSIEKHPNADKLIVTKVDIKQKDTIQIITAAKNVYEGAIVPIALNGAVLANNITIKNNKLRGILSEGMFCSINELGYTTDDYPEASKDGIYIFKDDTEIGLDVCDILKLKEDIIEFEITLNRPDCYSIIGMAREACAVLKKDFLYPKINKRNIKKVDKLNNIIIENDKLCNRYISCIIKDVKISNSPLWIRHRLISCGIKPINNIIDIANYVMLEFGQPIYAYDINSISNNEIIIRNAKENEEFITLDGIKRKLDETFLVVSNNSKIISIAGITETKDSNIKDTTNIVLLECANYNSTNIRRSSKKLGLRTESSSKFEKNLDPNICLEAMNRCLDIIESLNYANISESIVDTYINKRNANEINYSIENINKLLGISLTKEVIEEILSRLEINIKDNIAYIPTFRDDLKQEVDIAEEVARLYGYNNILNTNKLETRSIGKKTEKQKIEDIIRNLMVSLGLYEIMTYSFESPKTFEKLNISENSHYRNCIKINNPLGEDYSIMRTNTLNSILNSLSLNYNKRNKEAHLFEISKIYFPEKSLERIVPNEKLVLTIGMYSCDKNIDFYYIKGIINELFKILGIYNNYYEESKENEFMHRGRNANIYIEKTKVGFLGELDIDVQNNYNIGERIYIANIDIDSIYKFVNLNKVYLKLPKFPSTSRDISIIVKDNIKVIEIENIIIEKSKKLLEDIKLVDIYKGSQIEKGYKSISYSMTFRSNEKTLIDEEINNIINNIIKELDKRLNAKLRSIE